MNDSQHDSDEEERERRAKASTNVKSEKHRLAELPKKKFSELYENVAAMEDKIESRQKVKRCN